MKEVEWMIHDQHVHSRYSIDSKQELEPMVILAMKNKAKYFITCDHVDFDLISDHSDWVVDFEKYDQDIELLKNKYPMITFLKGVELGYRKDRLEKMKEILKRRFDLVNLSIHDNGIIDYYRVQYFIDNPDKVMNIYLDNIIEALENFDDFDCLSHMDYGFKTYKLYNKEADFFIYQEKIVKIMKMLILKDKTLEINIKVQSVINDESFTHLKTLLRLYKSLGGKNISLSSDSHVIDTYMKDFSTYMKIIKECGFDYLCYYVNREKHLYYIK